MVVRLYRGREIVHPRFGRCVVSSVSKNTDIVFLLVKEGCQIAVSAKGDCLPVRKDKRFLAWAQRDQKGD